MREERNSEDVGSPCDHGYPVTIKVSIVGPGGVGMARAYTLALKGVVRAPLDVRADHLDDVADFEVVVISASVPMNIDLKDRNAHAEGNPIKDTRNRREFFASTVGAGLEIFKLKGTHVLCGCHFRGGTISRISAQRGEGQPPRWSTAGRRCSGDP